MAVVAQPTNTTNNFKLLDVFTQKHFGRGVMVRGQGILDPFLGVEFKKQKKCFVRVVRQLFVAGDQKKITRHRSGLNKPIIILNPY